MRVAILAIFPVIGCYAGPGLSPAAHNAIVHSVSTLNPTAVVLERSATYGTSIAATLAGSPPGSEPGQCTDTREERRKRIESMQTEQVDKAAELNQDLDDLNQGW